MESHKKMIFADDADASGHVFPQIGRCPVCRNSEFQDEFQIKQMRVQFCPACQLRFLNPQPSNENLKSIYAADYFFSSGSPGTKQKVSKIKRATARIYLDMIANYSSVTR